MLQKMNKLREENKFCDVTVLIDDIEVQGHKIVFAAGSPFLRGTSFYWTIRER